MSGRDCPLRPDTSTNIQYTVGVVSRQSSVATRVQLEVYNLLGREVAVLVDEEKVSGNCEAKLDAAHLSSGVYLYRSTAGVFSATRKMVFILRMENALS